jgi:hypothetical protein
MRSNVNWYLSYQLQYEFYISQQLYVTDIFYMGVFPISKVKGGFEVVTPTPHSYTKFQNKKLEKK